MFVGDPSYVGTVGDVQGLADAAHEHDIPLIVDAAWAAHFGFHPDLPPHPMQSGADAMVTSAHKTLPAWSQAALVLARTERIDPARLDAGVEATATTSPAGAILASIDASRALLQRDGRALLSEAIAATRTARERLQDVEGLTVLDGPGVDPVKLTLVLSGTGRRRQRGGTGPHRGRPARGVGRPRRAHRGRLPRRYTPDPRPPCGQHRRVDRPASGRPVPDRRTAAYCVEPAVAVPPREAFFAAAEQVGISQAVGRVSAELIAPYPPGIPVLAPGEEVTPAVIETLGRARSAGIRIAYAADPTLSTIRVVQR